MIILPPDLARTWEEKSIQAGARIKDLMRQAIAGALPQLTPFLPSPSVALILVGSGHNGDDAVLLGLELKDLGWSVEYLLSRPVGRRLHPDSRIKPKLWKKAIVWPAKPSRFLQTQGPRLVIDGLLGLGSIPPPRPAEGAILTWVAQEKRSADLYVAMDLPSGLHPAPPKGQFLLGSLKKNAQPTSMLPSIFPRASTPPPAPSPVQPFPLISRWLSAQLKQVAFAIPLFLSLANYEGSPSISALPPQNSLPISSSPKKLGK